MNENIKKLLTITEGKPELAREMVDVLNTELCLGMTRYVCRYGTLGEGFDKLTDSQKYYQAIREIYGRANEISRLRSRAKKAYADYLEASEDLVVAGEDKIKKLRAEAALEEAELNCFELKVSAEDTLRQLDEFKKVADELQDKVRAQYPLGIEQAEPDNWRAIAAMNVSRMKMGMQPSIPFTALPLSDEDKFKVSAAIGVPVFANQNQKSLEEGYVNESKILRNIHGG